MANLGGGYPKRLVPEPVAALAGPANCSWCRCCYACCPKQVLPFAVPVVGIGLLLRGLDLARRSNDGCSDNCQLPGLDGSAKKLAGQSFRTAPESAHLMKLSVIMPVYNEEATVEEIVARVMAESHEKELIIVDDGSSDNTLVILEQLNKRYGDTVKLLRHETNKGKGAAVRTALAQVSGDVVIIQDADLEYDPRDYEGLVDPIKKGTADVVYGSRFLEGRRGTLLGTYLANRFLTFLTNLLYNANLTDMETCYKAIRASLLEDLVLRSNAFDIEPEITAKLLKAGARLCEVPITYAGRTYQEGKKIGWRDGLQAIWTLLKYRFTD